MKGRVRLRVGGVVTVLLQLDAQPPRFLQQPGEAAQLP